MKRTLPPRHFALLALVLTGLTAAVLSALTPWVGDDIEYAFMAEPGSTDLSGPPVQGLRDVMVSQWHHYFHINGRTVAHTLVQVINPLLGQAFFAVANGLMHLLFVVMLVRQTPGGDERQRAGRTVCAAALVLITFNTQVTPTCQVGYVWMFTGALWWTALFFDHADSPARQLLWLAPLSLVAGWGQEALNVGLCGALLLHLARHRRLSPTQWAMMAAFGLGTLLICLSPGTLTRAGRTEVAWGESARTFLRFSRVFYLLLLYAAWLLLRHRAAPRDLYRDNAFYANALLVLLVFNFAIGIKPPARQLFGPEVVSLVLLLRLWSLNRGSRRERALITGLLLAAAVAQTAKRTAMTMETRRCYDAIVRESLTAPDGSIIYSHFRPDNRLWPGEHHARTIERKLKYDTGKTLIIRPAPEAADTR